MKKMLKFQLKDLSCSYLVYALVMILLTCTPLVAAYMYDDVHIIISGNGLTSPVFCLVVGLAVYKEHCQMAVQNSISRKDFFKSSLCVMIIISAMCTLLDVVTLLIQQAAGANSEGVNYFEMLSIWEVCYSEFAMKNSWAAVAAVSCLLSFLVSLVLFAAGLLIAGGYLRLAKRFRTAYCVALPVFVFGVLPVLGTYFQEAFRRLGILFMNVMGISNGNPFQGMLTLAVTSAAIAGICYGLLKKTSVC